MTRRRGTGGSSTDMLLLISKSTDRSTSRMPHERENPIPEMPFRGIRGRQLRLPPRNSRSRHGQRSVHLRGVPCHPDVLPRKRAELHPFATNSFQCMDILAVGTPLLTPEYRLRRPEAQGKDQLRQIEALTKVWPPHAIVSRLAPTLPKLRCASAVEIRVGIYASPGRRSVWLA